MNIIDFSKEQDVRNYGREILDELKEIRDDYYEDEWDISRIIKIGTKQFQNPLLPQAAQEKIKEKLLEIVDSKIKHEEIECCYTEYYVSKLQEVKNRLSEAIEEGKDQIFDTVPKNDIEEKNMDCLLNRLGILGIVENSLDLEIDYYKNSVDNRKKLRDAYENYSTSLEKVPAIPAKEKINLKVKKFMGN